MLSSPSISQACSFLNTYLHLRGRCQESYYNLGRAMHQLGLLPAALHYYKKALDLEPAVGSGKIMMETVVYCLLHKLR